MEHQLQRFLNEYEDIHSPGENRPVEVNISSMWVNKTSAIVKLILQSQMS